MADDALPAAATSSALTEALRRAGVLPQGQVRAVAVESDRTTILSRLLRLRLSYDGETPAAPSQLILKTGLPRTSTPTWSGGRNEVAFYTDIAPELPADIVPRCFDAGWSAESGQWHLLLEDLTETHRLATIWPLPPSLAACRTILTAHARLHAVWWNDPRLGVSVGSWLDAGWLDNQAERLHRRFTALVDRLGDSLTPARRAMMQRFIQGLPTLFARYDTHRDMTITQGDSHVWNCFLPKEGGAGTRLFDWDSWRVHVAALDLSYMMAMHWYPDRRRHYESALLDHYHEQLLANGVTNYDRSALDRDYRWGVMMQLATPINQCAIDIPPMIWWNNLERILMAAEDWDCQSLLP